MSNVEIPGLYKHYFIDKQDERKMLFEKIAALHQPRKGIYPGSFVHITPSFYIHDMTYIDSDRRIAGFFSDSTVLQYIETQKKYSETPAVRGIQADFSRELSLEEHSFDIMFSF